MYTQLLAHCLAEVL